MKRFQISWKRCSKPFFLLANLEIEKQLILVLWKLFKARLLVMKYLRPDLFQITDWNSLNVEMKKKTWTDLLPVFSRVRLAPVLVPARLVSGSGVLAQAQMCLLLISLMFTRMQKNGHGGVLMLLWLVGIIFVMLLLLSSTGGGHNICCLHQRLCMGLLSLKLSLLQYCAVCVLSVCCLQHQCFH